MIIFFGVRAKAQIPAEQKTHTCLHCGSTDTVFFYFIMSYFHIFWIPVFPLNKSGASICTHCKQKLSEHEMPSSLKIDLAETSKLATRPWTHYIGLIVIGIVICISLLRNTVKRMNIVYQHNPLPKDVYSSKETTLFHVIENHS